MEKKLFLVIPSMTIVCKNNLKQYLLLKNKKNKTLTFFKEIISIPMPFTETAQHILSIKLGISIKIMGILQIETNIDKKNNTQVLNIIYYGETLDKSIINDYPNEDYEYVWLKKEEILVLPNDLCLKWIEFIEKNGRIYPINYLEDEDLNLERQIMEYREYLN